MRTIVAQFLRGMWREYRRTNSADLRTCLIEYYLPLVRNEASKLQKRLPAHVSADDLCSAGNFGLLAAIDHFDLSRGNLFQTFARPKIKGQMLDYLRDIDFLPRQERALVSKLSNTTDRLSAELGRPPSMGEIRSQLGVSQKVLTRLISHLNGGAISLSRTRSGSEGSKDLFEQDLIADRSQPKAISAIQRQDLKQQISQGLSRAERLIVTLYYYEDLSLREIGQVLDLSESRISQMRTTILERLRIRLKGREQELAA